MWAWLVGGFTVIAAFFIALRTAKESGRQEQRADDAEESFDDIYQANIIRDRVNSDSEYAQRVRDRFTKE